MVDSADRHDVMLGFEPEPGMLVDRLDGYDKLTAGLGHPARFGLTLDLGHCVCVEDDSVPACVARAAPRLVNVHIEDMRRGVHEHLDFGDGEVDFPAALGALRSAGYRGLVSVELSRHSHVADVVVPRALPFLLDAESVTATNDRGRCARLAWVEPFGADELEDRLWAEVGPIQLRWLEEAVDRVRQDPTTLATTFPAVGRKVGRHPLVEDWTVDDASRVVLLLAAGDEAWSEIDDLYRFGDAAERRGVLRALPYLPGCEKGLALVEDAIRTNDPRLIAAALSSYALESLDDHAFNQAVLKCVFVGVPLTATALVASPDRIPGSDAGTAPASTGGRAVPVRVTPELAEMVAGFVHERVAAGRDVPPDVWPLVEAHPPLDVLAAIEAELEHPVESRREAAAAALAQRAEHRQS